MALTLDLHGVRHKDVEDIVHSFINTHWQSEQELHIITGHSSLMKSLVKKVLSLYDVEIEEGDLTNFGYIRVTL